MVSIFCGIFFIFGRNDCPAWAWNTPAAVYQLHPLLPTHTLLEAMTPRLLLLLLNLKFFWLPLQLKTPFL